MYGNTFCKITINKKSTLFDFYVHSYRLENASENHYSYNKLKLILLASPAGHLKYQGLHTIIYSKKGVKAKRKIKFAQSQYTNYTPN